MFEKLGQIAALLQHLPKIRAEMERLQHRLGQIAVEGAAGGGMVKVKVSGRLEVVSCTLSDDVLKMNDREVLEDLIRAAANQALERAREQAAEETTKMARGFGLPPGFGLPGMPNTLDSADAKLDEVKRPLDPSNQPED